MEVILLNYDHYYSATTARETCASAAAAAVTASPRMAHGLRGLWDPLDFAVRMR